MKAELSPDLVIITSDDVPAFKRGGSVVRNSYFWALKAIAGYAPRSGNWEFQESGYLGLSETQLEFPPETSEIPDVLKLVSTWQIPNENSP